MVFNEDILKISDSIGSFIEYWGFRKIDGKIWVLVYLAQDPIDAQVLIKNLNVSKGLISISLKTLIEYKLIEEIDYGNNRSKFYRAHTDPMGAIIHVLKTRERIIVNRISDNFMNLNHSYEGIDNDRLKLLSKLVRSGDKFLTQIIKFKNLFLKN